jgi:hypothetical protein
MNHCLSLGLSKQLKPLGVFFPAFQYSSLNHNSPTWKILISLKQPPHLDVAMGSCNDINALATLLILQDAGIVFSCQDKQQVLALPLETKIMPSKEILSKTGTCPSFKHAKLLKNFPFLLPLKRNTW